METYQPLESNKEEVKVYIKFTDNSVREVLIDLGQKVSSLKENAFASEISKGKEIKLISQGKLMRNEATLSEYSNL